MADLLVLGIFCGSLLLCLICGFSILWALAAGLLIFSLDARRRGFGWGAVGRMALDGVRSVRNILLTFLFIGVLTACWRASGTIPAIVCAAASLIRPSIFLLAAFLLNCGVSLLTGTSFGTSATMGVICAAMAPAMGTGIAAVGGAVLSGAFFGDRCSPVSTSALFVAECTGTDLYKNIRRMLSSALIPFLITCAFYAFLGMGPRGDGPAPDVSALFGQEFVLGVVPLLPAAVVLVLAFLRVPVRRTLAAGILTALPLCVFLQGLAPAEILRAVVFGFEAKSPEVAALLNGGGIVSMLRVSAIVCISSSYGGIFRQTGLLDGLRRQARGLARRTTEFCAVLVTGVLVGLIACNQTLATMLAAQICSSEDRPADDLALDLEDSVIVTSALIPWSIAGAAPLAVVGAPSTALLFAGYLYILPLWRLGVSFWKKARAGGAVTEN